MDGAASQHHLEAIVVFRVVTAGHLDAAVAQRMCRKVQHGRGHHADIDHLDTGLDQSLHQGRRQLRPAQTAIAPHGHYLAAVLARPGAKGTTQRTRHLGRDGVGHDTAHVIGLENRCRYLHGNSV